MHLVLGSRIELGQKPPDDEIIELLLVRSEVVRSFACRKDGMVVLDLGGIADEPVAFMHPAAVRAAGQLFICRSAKRGQRFMHLWYILLGDKIGIRSWIRDHFMLLIERLGHIQCLLGGEAELAVRLPLKQRQVVQAERVFLRFFHLVGGDPAELAFDLGCYSVGLLLLRQTVSLPHSLIGRLPLLEHALHLIILK
ncbi:hypothetical protein D3C81_106620 [compost metagenome]